MKRKLVAVLLALSVASLAGCGQKDAGDQKDAGGNSTATEEQVVDLGAPEDVLNKIWETYTEDNKFAAMGGDFEHAADGMAGAFDLAKTEDMESLLGLPQDQAGNVTQVASLMHAMNANTFTGACYRLAEGVDVQAFANAIKENLLAKQWMCGIPDKVVMYQIQDSYLITAFGSAQAVDYFKTQTTENLEGVELVCEEGISADAAQ